MRPETFGTAWQVLGTALLLCACDGADEAGNEAAGSPRTQAARPLAPEAPRRPAARARQPQARLRVVSAEDTVPRGACRLTLDVPREEGRVRSNILVGWGCSRFTVNDTTMAQLQELGQLDDLPPWVVETMRNNEAQGLLLMESEVAAYVVYLDDFGELQQLPIAD